jgi:hypothetical protein
MRIFIHSAPDDLAIAQQLADLVAQQPALAPDSPITVAAAAKHLIDQHQLVVFLLSPEAVHALWLVDVAEYATPHWTGVRQRLFWKPRCGSIQVMNA